MSAAIRHLSAIVLIAACGGANAEQADPQACAPVDAPASDVTATDLAGEYTVRLIATSGTKEGAATGGRLALMDAGQRVPFCGAVGRLGGHHLQLPALWDSGGGLRGRRGDRAG